MNQKCCRTCQWHEHESIDDGYVCVNADSEHCTDLTENEDCCEEWEENE